jgi:hypothetical protein
MLLEGVRIRYLTEGIPVPVPEGSHPLEDPGIVDTFRSKKLLAENKGLPVKNIVKFLENVNFESRYTPVNPYTVQDMLSHYGPLLHMTKFHARVITGITIIDEQNAVIEYNDPGDGKKHTAEFTQFFIDHPGIPQSGQHLLMFVSPTALVGGQKLPETPTPDVIPDKGLTPDASIYAPDAGPHDAVPPAGVSDLSKNADTISDLSERIKILDSDSDSDEHINFQESHAYRTPDLSERIKVLDFDETTGLQEQHTQRTPDLSERIKILDFDETTGLQDGIADFDERGPIKPFQDHNPFDQFGADQLRDTFEPEERDSTPQIDWPNRVSDLQERNPIKPFQDHNPFDRFGADQLRDTFEPEERDSTPHIDFPNRVSDLQERNPIKPFQDHNPFDQFGADQLRDTPKPEPFEPFKNQLHWSNQQPIEPPQFEPPPDFLKKSLSDKPKWKK